MNMASDRETKQIERALRTIPVDAVASTIAADEATGSLVWCLIDETAQLVSVKGGGQGETLWSDPLVHAIYVRWLRVHPERVHVSYSDAVAFARTVSMRTLIPKKGSES